MTVETTLAMVCPATTGRGVAANQRQDDSEAVRMESILTILFYSEKGHSVCTRGVAKNVVVKGQPSVSYVMECLVDTRISSSIAQIESQAPRTAPSNQPPKKRSTPPADLHRARDLGSLLCALKSL